MTTLPQTRQRTKPAQDNHCRSSPAGARAGAPEEASGARARGRESLPAIDPSTVYGCVDWFLYPDAKAEPELSYIAI